MSLTSGLTRLLASRRHRVWVVLFLVGIPALAILPHLRGLILRNAVVTAFVYTARAPISGRVASLPAHSGLVIADGRSAAAVEDPRVDDALVSDLRSRERSQKDVVTRLDEQLRVVHGLETKAGGQLEDYRKGFARDNDQRIASTRATVEGLEARIVDAKNKASRARALNAEGMLSTTDLDSAVAALQALEADRDAQKSELVRLEAVSRELGAGRVLAQGPDEAVRLEQELARLHAQRLDIEMARVRAATELKAAGSRLEAAEKRFGLVRRAPVEVPDGVVVFRIQTYEGEHVEAGAPVFSWVDCRELLLDMRVDDSVLSLVKEGQVSRFRVFGSTHGHLAHAALVRGSAAVIGQEALATAVPRTARDGQVLSRIDADPELANGMDFCGIGRTAYTKLDGVGLYRELLRRLFL